MLPLRQLFQQLYSVGLQSGGEGVWQVETALNNTVSTTITCHYVNQLATNEAQCHFVRHNGSCAYDGPFYSYAELTYCHLAELRPVAVFVLVLVLLMLFVSIGSLADDFLCPSLLTISKTFRLPDHIAGVTLLAFGNSAPDVFASISGISQSKPDLIFASLFGGGIFITTIVTGGVLWSGEFAIMKMVLRDILFYVGACFLVWLFILLGTIQLVHSLSLVGYYFVYIATLVIGRFIFLRFKGLRAIEPGENEFNDESATEGVHSNDIEHDTRSVWSVKSHAESGVFGSAPASRRHSVTSHGSAVSTASTRKKVYSYENGIMLTRFYRSGSFRSPRRRSHSSEGNKLHAHQHQHGEHVLAHVVKVFEAERRQGMVEDTRYAEVIEREHQAKLKAAREAAIRPNRPIVPSGKYVNEITFTNNFSRRPRYLQQLSYSSILSRQTWLPVLAELHELAIQLSPVDVVELRHCGRRWHLVLLDLVKAVPYTVMTMCIPVVDIESAGENWCRLLTCLNLICAPQVVLALYGISGSLGSLPLWALLLMISLVLSGVVFATSERSKPPRYHRAFGFVGFAMSVVFINAIAEEVISVLSTFGVIFGLSDSILGLTVLAWGNSLGDLIANNSLARHGYPGIAIAACLGGPLLNMLLGVGLPYSILILGEERSGVEVHYTNINTLLFATIMTSLFTTIAFFVLFRFKSSKVHSATLISIYLAYVVVAVMLEFEVFY